MSGVLPTRLWVSPSSFNLSVPHSTRAGISLYPVTLEDGQRIVPCMVCRPMRADTNFFLGALWTAFQV